MTFSMTTQWPLQNFHKNVRYLHLNGYCFHFLSFSPSFAPITTTTTTNDDDDDDDDNNNNNNNNNNLD